MCDFLTSCERKAANLIVLLYLGFFFSLSLSRLLFSSCECVCTHKVRLVILRGLLLRVCDLTGKRHVFKVCVMSRGSASHTN